MKFSPIQILLVLSICSACCASALAQLSPCPGNAIFEDSGQDLGYSNMVALGDLDGDGDQDVLSASVGRLAWYENLGGGSFGPQQVITTASNPHSIFAEDIDGDGEGDVLSASEIDDKIAWYEKLGGGS